MNSGGKPESSASTSCAKCARRSAWCSARSPAFTDSSSDVGRAGAAQINPSNTATPSARLYMASSADEPDSVPYRSKFLPRDLRRVLLVEVLVLQRAINHVVQPGDHRRVVRVGPLLPFLREPLGLDFFVGLAGSDFTFYAGNRIGQELHIF